MKKQIKNWLAGATVVGALGMVVGLGGVEVSAKSKTVSPTIDIKYDIDNPYKVTQTIYGFGGYEKLDILNGTAKKKYRNY